MAGVAGDPGDLMARRSWPVPGRKAGRRAPAARDDFAAQKFAFDSGYADRQQAAARFERAHGSGVELQVAGEPQVVGQPLLARGQR